MTGFIRRMTKRIVEQVPVVELGQFSNMTDEGTCSGWSGENRGKEFGEFSTGWAPEPRQGGVFDGGFVEVNGLAVLRIWLWEAVITAICRRQAEPALPSAPPSPPQSSGSVTQDRAPPSRTVESSGKSNWKDPGPRRVPLSLTTREVRSGWHFERLRVPRCNRAPIRFVRQQPVRVELCSRKSCRG